MKKFLACLIVVISVVWALDAGARFPRGTPYQEVNPNLRQQNFFGLTGSAWQDTANYYVPGTGNPAVSTADYYHTDGVMWFRPYDLTDAACGSTGVSIAAANGRYVWLFSPDHSAGYPWADAQNMRIGYSNDPGVLPTTTSVLYVSYRQTALAQIATVTASISNGSGGPGNILNVTAVTGVISYESAAVVNGSGVTQARITAQTSGTAAGIGNYTINGSAQLVASQTMTIAQDNFGIGQSPWLVCNPDDATYPFYVYAEGANANSGLEQGLIKSSDLVNWTDAVPAFISYNFSGFTGYQRTFRAGVNDWYSIGFQSNFPQTGNAFGYAVWSSINGRDWTPNPSTLLNPCLPANASGPFGNQPCTQSSAVFAQNSGAPARVTVSSQDYTIALANSFVSGSRSGNQWVSRIPINSTFDVQSSPARVDISAPYNGQYPGPNYVNNINAYGPEDGILHYYAQAGYPPSSNNGGTVNAAYFSNGGACIIAQATFEITNASISGTTLTVGTTPPYPLLANQQIWYGGNNTQRATITAQLTGPAGGAGTYTVSVSQTVASTTMGITTCGGLWQQGIDYYTEVVDASAAASAAPVGVRATCAAGTATLTWYNSLPHQNYRVYRGTSAGSQPTLVGDVSGTSTTDAPGVDGVYYYKVVTMNGGEQKDRVVSTYCSSSSAFVNAHMTRALAGGADASTCNKAWMDTFDAWLVSEGLSNNLLFATDVGFCVIKDGSNVISKIFDMGTTRLPIGGDYTTATSSTTYNATGINSNPAWVNGSSTARGYYGGGRFNTIRRKTQITLFAAYQKPNTSTITPFVMGQFGGRIYLEHASGTPGSINAFLADATTSKTATVAVSGSATDFHTAALTFNGTDLVAYSDGTGGTPQTGLTIPSPNLTATDMLTGQIDNNPNVNSNWRVLVSGSDQGIYNNTTGLSFSAATAQYNGGGQFVFDKGLSGGQVSSFNALIRTHYGL